MLYVISKMTLNYIKSSEIERVPERKGKGNSIENGKFYVLQQLSEKLGKKSWRWTIWELVLFIISGIIYFLAWVF
jgi:hypothetical protein